MSVITVNPKQSMLDLALQHYGTLKAVIDLAFANERSLTDELFPGEILVSADSETEPEILEIYREDNVKPATALTDYVTDIINDNDPCDLCKCFT